MQFEEIDIRKTPDAIRDLRRLGIMATPALFINDKVIVGFDRAHIDEALSDAAAN